MEVQACCGGGVILDIPDSFLVVRGGQSNMPKPGHPFSAVVGESLEESAAGVPHGWVRLATAGQIRSAGGRVEYLPEMDQNSGTINHQHVHVTEAGTATAFGPPRPNPVPKRKRFGGPDYQDPGPLFSGAAS